MAIDTKYGKVAVPGIPDNEPVFILRAQDLLALPTILHYSAMIDGLDRLEDRMSEGLRRVVLAFTQWPGTRKLPD